MSKLSISAQAPRPRLRKTLSAPGLLREVRASFERIEDTVAGRGLNLTDCLMSGLAIFGLKYASLLQFERDARQKESIGSNLRSLYGVRRGAVGHGVARAVGQGGPALVARGVQACVGGVAAGPGPGGFHLPGRDTTC